jgi:hypothetical protein
LIIILEELSYALIYLRAQANQLGMEVY